MQFGAELLDKSVFSAFGICYTPSLGRMVRVSLTMVFRAIFLLSLEDVAKFCVKMDYYTVVSSYINGYKYFLD